MSRRILMIIAPDQFRDEELQVPRQRFEEAGWAVDTVSTQPGEAKGMLGAVEPVSRDLAWAQAQLQQQAYDAAVVVGGMGSPAHLWEHAPLHQLLKQVAEQGRVVAAICLSGAVLAKAGLLDGKRATVWEMPESVQVFQAHRVQYTGEPVTVDGNFITANGPDAAADFAEAILARIKALTPA